MVLEDYSVKEGLTAIIAAVFGNTVVVALSQMVLGTSKDFMPLTYGPVMVFTAAAGLVGFVIWEFFKRYREHEVRDYLLKVSVITLLSFATVVFATEQPNAGMIEVVMLSLTHANAAVVFTATLLASDK
jgi:H+/Cl- antiporter ClcA